MIQILLLLGLHYGIIYPFHEFKTGRNLRMSPIYPKLREAGAVFGQVMGYERPTWFDPNYMSGMYLQWIVWHHVGTNLCQFDDISQERQFLCKGIVLPFIIVIVLFLLFFLFFSSYFPHPLLPYSPPATIFSLDRVLQQLVCICVCVQCLVL